MDLAKSIRIAVESGKVELGSSKTKKNMLVGKGKLVITASNCPKEIKQDIQTYSKISGMPVLEFNGTSIELGRICGKPFPIASMCIIEEGNSDILKVIKN